jgi:hypothetical protein
VSALHKNRKHAHTQHTHTHTYTHTHTHAHTHIIHAASPKDKHLETRETSEAVLLADAPLFACIEP